jgi:hypothetical protein
MNFSRQYEQVVTNAPSLAFLDLNRNALGIVVE